MIMRRTIVTVLAGAGAAVLSAVIVAILDLYLSGHGYQGLTQERVTWSALGIHLSIGDIFMLGAVLVTSALTWVSSGR